MKIELRIKNQGHVPSFKNNKRAIRLKNNNLMLVTEKKTKAWMQKCIQSFESQLFSSTLTTGPVTSTVPHLRSLIASSLPQDDSRQWVPELNIRSEEVDAGEEGAIIIIEQIGVCSQPSPSTKTRPKSSAA
jgi:hypothetical protein